MDLAMSSLLEINTRLTSLLAQNKVDDILYRFSKLCSHSVKSISVILTLSWKTVRGVSK